MKKKLLKILMVLLIIPIFTNTTVEATFRDVRTTDWFYSDVMSLKDIGVIDAYPDGSFKPYNKVTYGEVLKMVTVAFDANIPAYTSGTHWALRYYNAAVSSGIIKSSALSSTQLDSYASKSFVAQCVYNGLGVNSVNSISPFVDVDLSYVNTLYHLGIASGEYVGSSLYFYPNNNVDRSETATLISKAVTVSNRKSTISKAYYSQPSGSYIKAPKTQSEYEQVLLYMAKNNITNLQLVYSDTGFKDLSAYYRYILPAFESVFETYPEIFTFANELSFGGSGTDYESELIITLKSYYFDNSTSYQMQSEFIKECEDVIYTLRLAGKITDGMSQYNKAKTVFEWLVLNKKYDEYFRSVSYTGYGISEYNTGVCQSYVANLNIMLKLMGISAYGVTGKVGNVDHMWAKASLDGVMVYMDPTYADPIPDTKGYCNFYYFDISEANLRKTHTF